MAVTAFSGRIPDTIANASKSLPSSVLGSDASIEGMLPALWVYSHWEYIISLCACDVNSLPATVGECMPRHLGEKLRHLRVRRNMSQADLAQQLGLARQAFISNLESGRKYPSLETIVKISEFFGISTDYLLKDSIPVESAEVHNLSTPPAQSDDRS